MKTKLGGRCALVALLSSAMLCVGVGVQAARAADSEPGGAVKAIKKPMALAFDRNTFEDTLKIISEEIGVPIEFIGTDLQFEGITKNQSLGLDEPVQPADQLLRKIFKKISPEGKLVYIIKPKAGVETIFITTRAGVEKRKDKLPAEFALPKPPVKTPVKPPANAPSKKR